MYTVPQSEQLSIFIASLGFGFLLGVLYDITRAIRLTFTKSKWAIVVFDIIYFLVFAFLTMLFILALNKGEVRSYIIAGQVIGWLFYYFSFGIAVIKFTDYSVAFIKKVFNRIYKLLTAPFRLVFRGISSIFGKICNVFIKTEKKSANLRKKHLPKLRLYVYNLFGMVSVRRKHKKKGGKHLGKKKKETN